MYEQNQAGRKVHGGKNNSMPFFLFPLAVAAPDLLDPKSATHNTKPRLSFSTKPMTLTPQEESEVRKYLMFSQDAYYTMWYYCGLFWGNSCMYVG